MTYENDRYWKQLQKYLPPHNRLTDDCLPSEKFSVIKGERIHIDHYQQQKPKARLILFHGVGSNGRLLSCIAAPLWKQGYEVICPDLPLYGYSEPKGTVTYETWVDCGREIVRQYQHDSVSVFLLGASAGGMLAYQVACRSEGINGIIATCLLDMRDKQVTNTAARNRVISFTGIPLINAAHRLLGPIKLPMKMFANMKAIANNESAASLLMKDKRSSGAKVSVAFLHTFLNPTIDIEPEDFNKCSVLLLHPEKDRWTPVSISERFFSRLACQKKLKLLKGAGHFPLEAEGLEQLEKDCVDYLIAETRT